MTTNDIVPIEQTQPTSDLRTPRKWNMRVFWPTEYYQLRVKEVTFSPSKTKGNPQVTLSCEVVAPETVDNGDDLVTVSGTPIEYYLPTTIFKEGTEEVDTKKTREVREKYSALLLNWDLPAIEGDDAWDNIDTSVFVGVTFFAMLKAKRNEKRKSPTAAQKAAGLPGDILMDPISGEKSITYYPQVDEVSKRVP